MVLGTVSGAAFNRTSLGLKQALKSSLFSPAKAFNRTSLGLKLNLAGLLRRLDRLLIEPVWD